MTQPSALPGQINGDAIDRFTLVHAFSGVVFGAAGIGRAPTIAAAVAWELAENPLKDLYAPYFPNATHDRPVNAITDIIAMSLGRELGAWLMRKYGQRR